MKMKLEHLPCTTSIIRPGLQKEWKYNISPKEPSVKPGQKTGILFWRIQINYKSELWCQKGKGWMLLTLCWQVLIDYHCIEQNYKTQSRNFINIWNACSIMFQLLENFFMRPSSVINKSNLMILVGKTHILEHCSRKDKVR